MLFIRPWLSVKISAPRLDTGVIDHEQGRWSKSVAMRFGKYPSTANEIRAALAVSVPPGTNFWPRRDHSTVRED